MRDIKKVKSVRWYGIVWAFCLVFIVCSCGGGSSSGPSSESGEISFSLRLEEGSSDSAELQEESTGLDCSGNHIDTIKAEILDSAGEVIARGGPFNCTDGHLTVTGVPVGQNYVVAVTALDLDGFVIFSGEETGVTVAPGIGNEVGPIILRQVLNRKPRIMPSIGNRHVLEGETLQFPVHAEDPDAAHHVTCTASDLPAGAEFDEETGLFSWTPEYGKAGLYRVMFRAVDDGDPPMSDAEIVAISVGDGNQPPVVWPLKNYAVQMGETVSFNVTASDPDQGDTLTFSASNLPPKAVFNPETRIFTWATGPEDAGAYIVSFLVMDNGNPPLGNGRQVTITVGDDVDHMPEMDPIGSQQVLVNQLLEFVVTARDLDGDALVFSATGLPDGAAFDPDTQKFSWNPGFEDAGIYEVEFAVEDVRTDSLSDTETVTITVGNLNRPPVFEEIGEQSIHLDTESLLSFTVTAKDPDGDALAYVMMEGPEGAVFADQTFQWAPTGNDVGMEHSAIFIITDDEGLSDKMMVNIRVTDGFPVSFPDANLDAVIREQIHVPTGDIMKSDLLQLYQIIVENRNIRSIEGLQHCENLQSVDFNNNQISDLGPLAGLSNLQRLDLSGNQISDLGPLAGLGNLQELFLDDNQISALGPLAGLGSLDILILDNNQISNLWPLAALGNLQRLSLVGNNIKNLGPLAGLANLQSISLYNNQISDISPLAGMANLQSINLGWNQISDIRPLAGMANLQSINLGWNQISDISPLAGMANLQSINLDYNPISDMSPVSGLAKLQSISLYNNQISDISFIAGMANLQNLNLESNQISDISPVARLANLRSISLYNNQISDISFIADMANLQSINLGWNQISDISPLAGLANLQSMQLDGNQISDISPLAGMANLQSINLGWNQISDISPLAGMANLQNLNLESNPISDMSPVSGLANLQNINLDLNQISDISPLAGLANLQSINLGWNQISDISPLAGMANLQSMQLDGNQISDISPLAGMANLQSINLGWNQISDISPLAGMANLQNLNLESNQISDMSPLSGLVNLQNINLELNQISDITPLAGMANLQNINLQFNQISDISPLAGLANLQSISLYNNQISDISLLAGMANLQSINLGWNQISDITPLAGLANLLYIGLSYNQISDITPLASLANLQSMHLGDNQISDITPLLGLNNLVFIDVGNNPLDVDSCTSIIPQLEAKMVSVWHTCP